jgi:ElaB/YqjD/DUF883 family membrane-anchored ribosome-binding protein
MSTIETDTQRNLEDRARFDELEDREPQVIEREIDATRADMRATLEALERRLSFDRLVEITVGRLRERGSEVAGHLTDAASRNAVPLLLLSIGAGWLMMRGKRDQHSYTTSGTYGERKSNIHDRASAAADKAYSAMNSSREKLMHAADSSREALRGATESTLEHTRERIEHTREALGHTAESLRENASRAASMARERAEYARERADRLMHEQPLMLGALGIAAGAIIGALIPMTQQEDRYLGEARNKAVKNLAEKSREAVKNVTEKSRALHETARDNAATQSAPELNSGGDAQSSGGQQRGQPAQGPH